MLPGGRFALGYSWVDGRRITSTRAWQQTVAEAAKLANAPTAHLPAVRVELDVPRRQWIDVLGPSLIMAFTSAWDNAAQTLATLIEPGDLVLAHGDLSPANMLVDRQGEGWLIDFEYASLAPREWDAAKVLILSHRFGDPVDPEYLLSAWPHLDGARLAECVRVQEVLIIGWLVQMAIRGTLDAAAEARTRAQGLLNSGHAWRHLR